MVVEMAAGDEVVVEMAEGVLVEAAMVAERVEGRAAGATAAGATGVEEDVVVAMKVLNWAADRATVAPRPGTC